MPTGPDSSGPPAKGRIFNIQKFSIHDGEGIRTLVFMKGCSLRCRWCSNPESQARQPELCYRSVRCLGQKVCQECLKVCPEGALSFGEDGTVRVDRALCTACGQCEEACPAGALAVWGREYTVEQALAVVEEDQTFYSRSGGGLTIGGGDPILQPDFVSALLKRARERGHDTAIETAGHGPYQDLRSIAQNVHQVFFDIKHLDPDQHRNYIGVDNKLILANLRTLCQDLPDLKKIIRTPLIPGFNDSREVVEAIARLAGELPGVRGYELLPYHAFGEAKYLQLGREYPCAGLKPMDARQAAQLQAVADLMKGE